ncbi:TGF-beta-activated kinase 1 and MAP3K7-binding protein 3-like isoform X1 [Macrosteles quadrilineatus]|uniref:TGF-beta-activated kinase 1 and MAP3K7-binding protein 3-like isoform X1 n=2 Tax=Macrosteles quadrilineatus TaxID=74068 RepID=UPI0023E161D0|nr:TGF-beta-activated kinase 1 and MAP3K7-binding protein 3-like isoform X1 [Macrosteles quadrilineatus]
MAECPCSNISIMQLFHELKQKFPAVPDSVVTECIKLNSHDREACEAVLCREDQAYRGRVARMAAESCRPDTLPLEDTVWDFDRRLMGRQSLDSLQCVHGARRMCKQYSEEFLNKRDGEQIGAFSRLSISDEWRRGVECGSEDVCRCERTRVSVMSYGSPHSAPVTPSNPPPLPPVTVNVRHTTSLDVEPTPHYRLPEPSRPYTSVNLTLRPPSSDPQPPIDIRSGGGGLTYSSCSYDPRQGYQSHLQISIGPGGTGTVTAARTLHRPPPALRPTVSMPDVATTSTQLTQPSNTLLNLPPATRALVSKQLERKERLSRELARYRERLSSMKAENHSMATDLENRLRAPNPSARVKKLKEEISLLQMECNRMTKEVYHNAELRHVNTETLPLGETNEEFYKNIYRGQLFPRQAVRQRPTTAPAVTVVGEGRHWTCHVCTFHNHPALNKCEQCDMPRIITGSETQNIHIHVTHHNVPSSPYRRVVHSWVV